MEAALWATVGIALLIILLFVFRRPGAPKSKLDAYPFERRRSLFLAEEKAFFIALDSVVDGRAVILAKVRAADVLQPKSNKSASEQRALLSHLANAHFDFVLCDLNNLSVICAVILSSKNKGTRKRNQRDAFLARSCIAANLPLSQFALASQYNIGEIEKRIGRYLPKQAKVESTDKEEIYMWTKLQLDKVANK